VIETTVLERSGGHSSNKSIVCGRLRSMHGRKTDGVHLVIMFLVARSFTEGPKGSNSIEHQLSMVN
jgi:hypothetical protein